MPGHTPLNEFIQDTFDESTREEINDVLEKAREAAQDMARAFKSPVEFDEGEG